MLPVAMGLILAAPYRKRRLLAFLDPTSDTLGVNFQLSQSLIAVGSGGAFGIGLMAGIQKLYYLPEAHTDFIYAVAGEEFNLGSPKQLATILFEKLGLPPVKKTKTGYSTDVDVLEQLALNHALPAKLIEPERSCDHGRGRRFPHERRRLRHAFVNLAHDLFKEVFEAQHAGGAAVFVDDHREMRLAALHRVQHHIERRRFRDHRHRSH